METLRTVCQCACGSDEFELRVNRHEQAGLLTCAAGHHSLLLDSRDYWAEVLAEGRPKTSRCGCDSVVFRVALKYEFRDNGDVRSVDVLSICCRCARERLAALFEVKYSPTAQLISSPLDAIERPWLQPKRCQITSFWKPRDAQGFSEYLTASLGARIFCRVGPREFQETTLRDVEFFPELKDDLLFTTLEDASPPPGQLDPQNTAPFLRLTHPFHMHYPVAGIADLSSDIFLLHYVMYSRDVVRDEELQRQPPQFLQFADQAFEWLKGNYVSLRGSRTADNLEEYRRVEPNLRR